MYEHQWLKKNRVNDLPVGKVVCVGRNYAEHAKELNNPIPVEPLLFIKPASAVCASDVLALPNNKGAVHYEAELAILMGKEITENMVDEAVINSIAGVGLGLDLTLRDLQAQLKAKGHPWEKAKAFDNSCALSPFVRLDEVGDLNTLDFSLTVNGVVKQKGRTEDMITPVIPLIRYIAEWFSLQAGDVVLTGTPKGVGELKNNDTLALYLQEQLLLTTTVSQ